MQSHSIIFRVRPYPPDAELQALWQRVWRGGEAPSFSRLALHSLTYVCAYDAERLIGFVNVATDGGVHAFLLDTSVDPDYRRHGIGSELVRRAVGACRGTGVTWLHVDYEPHLEDFYQRCGLRHTKAGLIAL